MDKIVIKDEFDELLKSISKGIEDGSRPNADDVILKTYRFFSKLKEELKGASDSEKGDLMEMIRVMQEKVNEYSQKNCQKVGMSESELMRLSDDSNIFTPDQKRVLEMAKNEMIESAKTIRGHLANRNIAPKDMEKEKKESKPKKQKRRSDWMKS